MKSEDFILHRKKIGPNNINHPVSGQMCNIKMRENDIMAGTILHYFDDTFGIEHVVVDIGPIVIIRPSANIVLQGG